MKFLDHSTNSLFFYGEPAQAVHPRGIRAAIYIASICWH